MNKSDLSNLVLSSIRDAIASKPRRLFRAAMTDRRRRTGVYAVFGPAGNVYYVGKSSDIRARLAEHCVEGGSLFGKLVAADRWTRDQATTFILYECTVLEVALPRDTERVRAWELMVELLLEPRFRTNHWKQAFDIATETRVTRRSASRTTTA
jgi:hypothetical protein